MNKLEILINLPDGDKVLSLPRFLRAVNGLGGTIVTKAQQNLAAQDKVVTGALSESLSYDIVNTEKGIAIQFGAGVPYWDFVEQGAKGAASDAKAPESEYQFGTGTGQKGALKPAIRKWITDKGISNSSWRDKKGRFLSYDSMARRISRSVYLTGIKPSGYYKLALDQTSKEIVRKISNAIERDIKAFFVQEYAGTYTLTVDLG